MMAGGKFQHLRNHCRAANRRRRHRTLAAHQREHIQLDRFQYRTNQMQTAFRAQGINIRTPVEFYIHRRQNQIEITGGIFQRLLITGIQRTVCAQLQRFGALGFRRGKGRYFTTPGIEELQRHMAKATNTHHTNTRRGLNTKLHNRVKHRYATTEQRPGHFAADVIRQFHHAG